MRRDELVRLQNPRKRKRKPTKRRLRGRPPIGTKLSVVLPPWVLEQVEVVRKATEKREGKPCPQSEMIRDVVRVGLLAMHEAGVRPRGFEPAKARKRAELRDEPV